MKHLLRSHAWLLLVLCASLLGCKDGDKEKGPASPPGVQVTKVAEKPLGEFDYFTGRTAAVETVEIHARVSGYLQDVKFKDGAEVKADTELAVIDSATYQADFDRATADEKRSSDLLTEVLEPKYQRARGLPAGTISPEEFEKIAGDRLQGIAVLQAAKENKKNAKIKLDWCTVKAPISGVLSNARVTKGNLVQADKTVLTTIVNVENMYTYFDVDEFTLLAIKKRIDDGKFANYKDAKLPVFIGLANEKVSGEQTYPHEGTIDFVDNRLDVGTGTLKVRGVFSNPKKGDLRVLAAGLFVRVKLPIGKRDKALWVPDRALVAEQGRKVLFVVGADNKVEARPVTLLKLENGMRAIDPVPVVKTDKGTWRAALPGEQSEPSLKAGETVIVVGMQSVRPGVAVQTEPWKK